MIPKKILCITLVPIDIESPPKYITKVLKEVFGIEGDHLIPAVIETLCSLCNDSSREDKTVNSFIDKALHNKWEISQIDVKKSSVRLLCKKF